MGNVGFTNVDEYIAAQPETAQVVLQIVRSTIRQALPQAEEVISYKMPVYKLHGEVILYFAGWKQHYSLYPAKPHMVAAFKNELASCKVDKGTIRFPLSSPVPTKLIADIAKFRLAEVGEPQEDERHDKRKSEARDADQIALRSHLVASYRHYR